MVGETTVKSDIIRDIDAVKQVISEGTNFLITTHVNPDGDAIGSELAIYHYLRAIGQNARIINCSSTPGAIPSVHGTRRGLFGAPASFAEGLMLNARLSSQPW